MAVIEAFLKFVTDGGSSVLSRVVKIEMSRLNSRRSREIPSRFPCSALYLLFEREFSNLPDVTAAQTPVFESVAFLPSALCMTDRGGLGSEHP